MDIGSEISRRMRLALKKTKFKRRLFFILSDLVLISVSLFLAFWLRFEGRIPLEYFPGIYHYLLAALILKLSILALFGIYNLSWGMFGLRDAVRLFLAWIVFSTSFMAMVMSTRSLLSYPFFPRGVLVADVILDLSFLCGLRISKRFIKEIILKKNGQLKNIKRVLIVGAGEAGVGVCKEMLHNPRSDYQPVGFIDDESAKRGLTIQGVPVLGDRQKIPELLKKTQIHEILIAIPSASSKEIRGIVDIIRNAGQKPEVKILPSLLDLFGGNITLPKIEDIQIEDLLGRAQVEIDYKLIRKSIEGKRLLVTGAGGSIGSELVKNCLKFNPEKIMALDIDETELFSLENMLCSLDSRLLKIVADIKDEAKINKILKKYSPEVIIHAAAYKHVPVLEEFPEEAIKNNVLGTRILGEYALLFGVDKFINISTDKAINPTSVMGASKRTAEEMLRLLNCKGKTKFISVRFGNVLGSRGSVIPLFKEQIKRGGPVTVTHPDMKRYFMTTLEAVLLILEAGAIGQGGETFVLDMGEPVRIDDLAREMIRLSGKEPDADIPIIYTGIRPGEKLFEELIGVEEGSEPTSYQKIFKAKSSKYRDESSLLKYINNLIEVSQNNGSREEMISLLKKIVPTYKPLA